MEPENTQKNVIVYTPQSPEATCLCQKDPILGALIGRIGNVRLRIDPDIYVNIVSTIVGQQLSSKAADTIWSRVVAACGGVTPENVLNTDPQALRAAGMSGAKINYVREFSQKAAECPESLAALAGMTDAEAVKALTGMKGIGKWTAEMILIFSLGRQDVFSMGDAGLQRAAKWLYGMDTPEALERVSSNWAPYRSVASLYLWAAIDRGLVGKPWPGEAAPIHSERLYMRPFRDGDLPALEKIWGDREVMRYCEGSITTQEMRRIVDKDKAAWEKHGNAVFAVVRREDNALIGIAGCKTGDEDPRRAELVYHFAQSAWGQGYATETVAAYIAWLRQNRLMDLVYAVTMPENAASIRVLEKSGFARKGLARLEECSGEMPYFELIII